MLLTGSTKDRIFEESIRLFSEKSYERVSIRQIAAAVGIKESSIYNHYRSKEEILDHILEYFQERHRSYWVPLESVQKDMFTESPESLLGRFFYSYDEYEYGVIMSMFRIMFMEQYRNKEFQRLFTDYFLNEQRVYIKKVFDLLVEGGRLLPFDTDSVARIWIRANLVAAMRACHKPGIISREINMPVDLWLNKKHEDVWKACIDLVLRNAPGRQRDSWPVQARPFKQSKEESAESGSPPSKNGAPQETCRILPETTKNRIFLTAIRLYGERGYERVSIRELAAAVGIQESSIYNHYQGKEDILDHILKFFNMMQDRYLPTLEDFRRDMHLLPLDKLLGRFFYAYDKEDFGIMLSMHRILYAEQYRNGHFYESIIKITLEGQTTHMKMAMDILVEEGLLLPFNTGAISRIWAYSNMVAAIEVCQDYQMILKALAHPESFTVQEYDPNIYKLCLDMALYYAPDQLDTPQE